MADRNKFPFPPPLDTRWQQVTQFPVAELNLSLDDQEDEWTEEVEYLTFDFGHSHAPSPISSYSGFQLLGLNTASPFLKIGDQIYRGEYESLVGTELIMQPVSVSEKDKKTSRQRSGTEEPGEEGVEQAGIDEEEQGEAEEGEEGEEGEGEEKVEMKYEPLAHTRTRIRWLPVALTEVEGGPNESDSSSPEGATGTHPKTKKRTGAGAGGRHWASYWTKYTPRANAPKNKVVIQPQPHPQSDPQSQTQQEPQPQPQPESQSDHQPQPEEPQSQPQCDLGPQPQLSQPLSLNQP